MITLEPCNRSGRATWDESLLPGDEYAARLRLVQRRIGEAGVDAFVAVGHANDPGDLCYLTGFVPILGWGAVVVGCEGAPVLVTVLGQRELPYVRSQTWVSDIRTSSSLFAAPSDGVVFVLREMLPDGGTVGVAGLETNLDSRTHGPFLEALSAWDTRGADTLTTELRRRKRPRERLVLRVAADIARQAVSEAASVHAAGGTNAVAGLAAERAARLAGAHDVRLLANLHGDYLSPHEGGGPARRESLTLYCAVEYLGYWGEAVVTTPAGEETAASRAVAAMTDAANAGALGADVARAGLSALTAAERALAMAYGLGGGVGLKVDEGPAISTGCDHKLCRDEVLTLRAFVPENGRLVAAMQTIVVASDGARVL